MASCNDSRRQAKPKSRFIGDITACNAKSVGLPEPVLSVRIGRPQWSPPLSRCLQRRRDSELEGQTNSGSFMQWLYSFMQWQGTGRRPNAIPVFLADLFHRQDCAAQMSY